MHAIDQSLARRLVLDELFDLALYEALRDVATGDLRDVLEQLIPIEAYHVRFWQDFFDVRIPGLDAGRRLKLALIVGVCRLFGAPAIHLALEAIEVYGVRKYLAIWKAYAGTPLESAVREVLEDEFEHEDAVVTGDDERRINPERIRNIFLGLNDGLVEILGAVSGFFGAFGDTVTVLIAGSTTAVAGALSMAAGAWVATSSESEIRETEVERRRFLGGQPAKGTVPESPRVSAAIVGVSYFAGALVPILPVLAGARSALPSAITAGATIITVSTILAFLSGMNVRRRVLSNLVIIAAAVAISYGIGTATTRLWGVSP